MGSTHDAWDDVEDLEGTLHYDVLGLERNASADDVRRAYRSKARLHHPDKAGGDAETFAKVKKAYDVLGDPDRRKVYDEWQRNVEFRHVRGVASRFEGGEDLMLDEFEKYLNNEGLEIDPKTQLVVVCEVCSRPATTVCWTCKMHICEFCTLKRHWKDGFGLHWPLINKPGHMLEQLGRKEMEKKRIEDAKRLELEDPNFRNDHDLKEIRCFKDAAYEMLQDLGEEAKFTYDLRMAKYYMWAQTSCHVYLVVHIPTGYQDKEVYFECTPHGVKLQPENSPPVIHRVFDEGISSEFPIQVRRSDDRRIFTAALPKGTPGKMWKRLFRGDPDGSRCLEPLYSTAEDKDNVILEFLVPFWIEPEDVKVDIGSHQLQVSVRNELSVCKTYWRNVEEERKNPKEYQVVDVYESMWSLDEETDEQGEDCKCIMVNLVRPPLTQSEKLWKKGKRVDNLNTERFGDRLKKGFRFFVDDEDEFQLEGLLQALCFLETGSAYVPKLPWDHTGVSKRVEDIELLPDQTKNVLESLLSLEEN
jgi:curved DNA-binding protein CbpA/HSP20 family molecular chaperone IbpA